MSFYSTKFNNSEGNKEKYILEVISVFVSILRFGVEYVRSPFWTFILKVGTCSNEWLRAEPVVITK